MGMFDHMQYEDPLLNSFNGRDCQTKSLECDLHQYIIRNGHLFRLALADDITQDVEFYGFDETNRGVKLWNAYRVSVVKGKVQDVKLTEKAIYECEDYGLKNGRVFRVVSVDELKNMVDSVLIRIANPSVSSPVEFNSDYKYVLIREIEVKSGYYDELPRIYYFTYEEALQSGQDWFGEVTKGSKD